jgi:MinD-like ATPase involved in chromosome partitioning or flagellar assembly
MSLIALMSSKGAPGVTTASLALAAVWPRRVLVAECDPAGGDLAARWERLTPTPGLLTLASAARRRLEPADVWRHAQSLPGPGGEIAVLPGPLRAAQAAGMGRLWSSLGAALAGIPDADVLADCGRTVPGQPNAELVLQADVTVAIAHPTTAGVVHLRDQLAGFAESGARTVVVTLGERPYARAEVEAALRAQGIAAPVLGMIADDRHAAALLAGEPGSARGFERSLLIRSARTLAERLADWLRTAREPAPPTTAPPVVGSGGQAPGADAPGGGGPALPPGVPAGSRWGAPAPARAEAASTAASPAEAEA